MSTVKMPFFTIPIVVKILQNELLKQGDLYDGFLASIESAIREKEESYELWHNDIFLDTDDWAKAVLDRIIGLEDDHGSN